MANFDLNSFHGEAFGNDLARANRFEIEIFGPGGDGRLPSLLCEEAQVPGLQALWSPTKIGMVTENRVHGMEFFGEAANFTFYCDTRWNVRSYFEDWMKEVADFDTREAGFHDNFTGEVKVKTLDRQDNDTGVWTLKNAFPRMVNITPVGQGGDGIVRVSTTFAFRQWEKSGGGSGGGISLGNILSDIAAGRNVKEIMGGIVKDVINSRDYSGGQPDQRPQPAPTTEGTLPPGI